MAQGIGQPIFGANAEKIGDRKAIIMGVLIYVIGVASTSILRAILLIGLANIGGTLFAGYLGKSYSKKYLLAIIYTLRAIVATVFIMMPTTSASVIIFSSTMVLLWLTTVPLASGLVAHSFGLRYRGTLYGIEIFSHQ